MSVIVAGNDRQHRRVRYAATVAPGASWNGTAGSGGTAPAEDPTLRGTGWAHKAIGAFDEPRVAYMTDDLAITVGADHGDAAWIQEVMFWCEGNTATVSQVAKNPRTGSIGFVITLANASFPADGDAQVYAYIRPVNGYERRIGPITVTRMQDASRPVRYINPAGSDSNDGLSTATPWKSLLKATISAPSGAIVYCAAGTYYEDSNAGTLNNNARPIEFRRAAGLNLGDVVVTQTSLVPSSFWQPRAQNIIFDGILLATETIATFYGPSPSGAYVFRNCNIQDRNGITSGYDTWPGIGQVQIGRQINTEAQQTPFRPSDGQQNCLLESTCAQYVTAGFTLLRNSTLQSSADINFISGASALSPAIFNTSAQQMVSVFEQRRHLAHTLTVATISYTAGTVTNPDGVVVPGKTTITWNEATTYDTVATGGQGSQNYRFLTGALLGQQFSIYSQSGNNTVLYGDCTAAAAGDSARGYIAWHADTLQLGSQSETAANVTNVFIQRYKSVGPVLQVLWQAGGYTGQGTITTTGINLSCSTSHRLAIGDSVRVGTAYRTVVSVTDASNAVLDGAFSPDVSAVAWRHGKALRDCAIQLSIFNKTDPTSSIQHQWQHGHDHVVYRQNTLLGSPLTFRTDGTSNFGASGCIVVDSIIEAIGGNPAPTFGLTIDRNHLVESTSTITGTNYTSGDPQLDSNYRPQSSAVRTTTPTILFNQLGEPISAGAKVGALG